MAVFGTPWLAPRRMSDVAREMIRVAIVDGRLRPGQRLKEGELARELGMSRIPVREALLILQAEGLVNAIPNRGAIVPSYDGDEIDEIYQLRALLEGFTASRAAHRISARELGLLRQSCDRFERLCAEDEITELVKENLNFHSTILAAARSKRLARMVRAVLELPLIYRSFSWYAKERRIVAERYHRQIMNALAEAEPERAGLLMKEHILEARDFLVAGWRTREDSRPNGGRQ